MKDEKQYGAGSESFYLIWSVYVGSTEINDYYVTRDEAEELANEYVAKGYDDVAIISTDGEEIIIKE